MPDFTVNGSRLEKLSISGIENAFVISCPALEQILFDRNVIGLEFTHACQQASEAFFRHFSPEILHYNDDLAELVILSKGIYYWLHNAFEAVFSKNLETNFIATKRVSVSESNVAIEVPYRDFSSPTKNLIIADTVASGSTIVAALDHYMRFHALQNVLVFSIAGSGCGGRVIAEFCKSRNVGFSIVYGLAAFGLGKNGFDLSFLHPETICPNKKYLQRAFDIFEGKPVSAVGWDFASQAQATHKYKMLCWIEAEYWGLQNSNVFRIKEEVTDIRLVEKEKGAYEDRINLGK